MGTYKIKSSSVIVPLLIYSMMAFPCMVKGQKCYEHLDPITTKITRSGLTELFVDSIRPAARFIFVRMDSNLSVSFTLRHPGIIAEAEAGKMKLTLKFLNGQSKTFDAASTSNILKIPEGVGIRFDSNIDKAILSYFQLNPVVQVSLDFGNSETQIYSVPINELTGRQLIESISCLANDK